MPREIPSPVMSIVANYVSSRESHSTQDSLFAYADAPGEPPLGNKQARALWWLRRTNKESPDPLAVLGKLVENYMDEHVDERDLPLRMTLLEFREKLQKLLGLAGLTYVRGGFVTPMVGTSTRALADFIRDRDYDSINREFDRANSNAEGNPREAVSAASNILESVCKIYIEDEALETPSKQDLQGVWNVVRKELGLDPSRVEDKDLQQILTGVLSVVHGVGNLRTHSSSAHGAGRQSFKLEPRHARLAIHSAHTVVLFVLESWAKRRA